MGTNFKPPRRRDSARRPSILEMLAILAMWAMGSVLSQSFSAPSDPATDLVRTRLFLTTTAPAIDLTVQGASLANAVFTLRAGPESVRLSSHPLASYSQWPTAPGGSSSS